MKGEKTMKIAVAKSGEVISEHFGHSEGFEIFEVVEKTISPSSFLSSPVHEHGSLPKFLVDQHVDVLIAGGLGQGAVTKLSDAGIDVVRGITGNPTEAVKKFVDGVLESTGTPCSGHGDHNEHHHGHHHDKNHECHGHGHQN